MNAAVADDVELVFVGDQVQVRAALVADGHETACIFQQIYADWNMGGINGDEISMGKGERLVTKWSRVKIAVVSALSVGKRV